MIKYIVPTGSIIKEYLQERKITQKELATLIDSSERHVSEIITGKARVTEDFALKLEKVFPDIDAIFWLELEAQYQLDKLREESTKSKYDAVDLDKIIKDYQLDAVYKGLKYRKEEKVEQFLELTGYDTYQEVYNDVLRLEEKALFYKGKNSSIYSQYSWLKLCEDEYDIQNDLSLIKNLNKDGILGSLNLLKKLLNTTNFDFMITNVRRYLNRYGVGLVVMEAVPNSRVNGAVYMIDNRPYIFMSTYSKSLSRFYFVLLHEIHHILNDHLESSGYLDSSIVYEEDERETSSNEFAKSVLIDSVNLKEFLSKYPRILDNDIIGFANKEGVVVDVVVDFIEFEFKDIDPDVYKRYNHLKSNI